MELLLISCGSPDASGPPHTTEGLTEMWVLFFGVITGKAGRFYFQDVNLQDDISRVDISVDVNLQKFPQSFLMKSSYYTTSLSPGICILSILIKRTSLCEPMFLCAYVFGCLTGIEYSCR